VSKDSQRFITLASQDHIGALVTSLK